VIQTWHRCASEGNLISARLWSFEGNLLNTDSLIPEFIGQDGTYIHSSIKAEVSTPWRRRSDTKVKIGGYAEYHARFHRFTDDDGDGQGSWEMTFLSFTKTFKSENHSVLEQINLAKMKGQLGKGKAFNGLAFGTQFGIGATDEVELNIGFRGH